MMTDILHAARWYSVEPGAESVDGRLLCELCPRSCRLKPGDRGFCFVRKNVGGRMVLDTYGKSTGFCIDPIEKKPLNHFFPGTPVLSFGTAGCNLGCKFCQNWEISKSREVARLSDTASPEGIANSALQSGCRSVAFTYNDPVIWAEYAIDTAIACRQVGLKSVAVTAGYISESARGEFFSAMDAANIDLKAFSESFYHSTTASHLQPVLDTIRYVVNETDCWVELTNLIIPEANDDSDEIKRMCEWILTNVGPDVPIHFTAFHPDFRMNDRPATPHSTLIRAYELARAAGLRYVYVGNVHDVQRQSTYCHACGELLIERDWHELGQYRMHGDRCGHCQATIPGRFDSQPGTWGRRRQPIRIAPPVPTTVTVLSQPTVDSNMDKTVTLTAPLEAVDVNAFTQLELQAIHRAASNAVAASVIGGSASGISASGGAANSIHEQLGELAQRRIYGMYVTLRRGTTLRGCCGSQGMVVPLVDALLDSARRTACDDPRMSPIDPIELPYLNLGISLLGPPRLLSARAEDRVNAVVVGQHGVRIHLGDRAGLLLPSVATEYGWNSHQFLDAVCRKAGLPAGTWRSEAAELRIFDGVAYSAEIAGIARPLPESPVVAAEELPQIVSWVKQNLQALRCGATPSYYAVGVSDANVLGVALRVVTPESSRPATWLRLNLRNTVPLQMTLFEMSNQAAMIAASSDASQWQVDIAVLSRAVHHGSKDDADLEGLDTRTRAIVATDGRRWSVRMERNAPAHSVMQSAVAAEEFRFAGTQIHSVLCDCSCELFEVSIAPQADARVTSRPPAVAGSFYPASDSEREAMIDSLLSGLPHVEKQRVTAAMVPHAGLKYSGRIAADVWRRIEIPDDVLIIGPKHTADGVDWAVAPHSSWHLSASASLAGATDLAEQLAAAVPGLQLDASAHAREHGIEVQLPILYRLAPKTRVMAIAMHGGTLDELTSFAQSLAKWLSSLAKPPLLVISSDMNHFADDEENRRRDRLALDALQTLDAATLLSVCESESISMCGQLPAALVLLTLKQLGWSMDYHEIDYGTSAAVTGNTDRVVGYAGVLFT